MLGPKEVHTLLRRSRKDQGGGGGGNKICLAGPVPEALGAGHHCVLPRILILEPGFLDDTIRTQLRDQRTARSTPSNDTHQPETPAPQGSPPRPQLTSGTVSDLSPQGENRR